MFLKCHPNLNGKWLIIKIFYGKIPNGKIFFLKRRQEEQPYKPNNKLPPLLYQNTPISITSMGGITINFITFSSSPATLTILSTRRSFRDSCEMSETETKLAREFEKGKHGYPGPEHQAKQILRSMFYVVSFI
jgi:hypothetical protein